ncbi:MAG: Gfo/Idh/MocA family oxidoreductase [Paucibacter sp.]|nr:Gfo/Idh/MocA family oxidoreductase [Roseateles sp.]
MRHARILQELGCSVAVVSRRDHASITTYGEIGDAVLNHRPDYVVIANETALHHDELVRLAATGYQGTVLLEKPLFECVKPMPENQFQALRIAYNLRFHPVILRLKSLLEDQNILSVHCYVGQYLPGWRPETDYRHSYSAQSKMGGGVLLDLSHDLDYLNWMLGDWQKVSALGGQLSQLEITSDDIFTLLLSFGQCPIAAVQLNYLDRRGRRSLIVNTAHHTYEADLVSNKIFIDKTEETFNVQRDDTYRSMHAALLRGEFESLCSLSEALSTLKLISASRQSATNQEWVKQ